jgi:2-desacetyl-2-hydroxyethyl bacteriochlorophyllide A dehydrogenase
MSQSMKAAVYHGPRKITLEELKTPDVGAGDVLISVTNCGICGSDVHSYKTGMFIQPGQVMGHEFVGIATKVGRNVEGITEGSRVTGFSLGVCRKCYWCKRGEYILCPDLFLHSTGYGLAGGFAEYVKIANAVLGESIHLVPDELDDLSATTVEPVAVGVTAVDVAQVKPGDKVVVLGAGMIGNACLQAAKAAGAGQVAVIEVSPLRMKIASECGADAVFDARTGDALEWVMETVGRGRYHFNEGGMADVVFEAAGTPTTIKQSFEMVRSGGTICFVALPEKPALIDTTKIVHKLPRIIGSLGGDFAKSIRELASGRIQSRRLVTHVLDLEHVSDAFETQLDANQAIKVIVKTH